MSSKEEIRAVLRAMRDSLSPARRSAASVAACAALKDLLQKPGYVLSYMCFGSELDINPLNQWLADQNRLALPRVESQKLRLYSVKRLDRQLERGRWGMLEPIQGLCPEITTEELSCALVPALGFDSDGHRLGYGKAYFDRLLSQTPHTPAFGVGFTEQMLSEKLPIESHDHPMTALYLF